MTEQHETLLAALQASDMLEVDGLHAWDFSLDAEQLTGANADTSGDAPEFLRIECIDGRTPKRWAFSYAAVQAAQREAQEPAWRLFAVTGSEHRLVCMAAVVASNADSDEPLTED